MSNEQELVITETLYQRLIEEVRKYIPTAYIATMDEIIKVLSTDA